MKVSSNKNATSALRKILDLFGKKLGRLEGEGFLGRTPEIPDDLRTQAEAEEQQRKYEERKNSVWMSYGRHFHP